MPSPNPNPPPAVSMRGITKRFPGVLANDSVDFEARPGEVHTLLGENGAGKSTLMQVLAGLYRPDSGEIFVRGRRADFKNPRESLQAGLGMIYQHFMLVRKHTVLDNLILGRKGEGAIIDYRKVRREAERVSREYGLEIDPGAFIWQLSVGEQQRVEIVKMLLRRVDLLILDEPTAVLTPGETESLFSVIRKLASIGRTVIFISHKLNEVMEISDRITILRKGRRVETIRKVETDERELARLMVGREPPPDPNPQPAAKGEAILEVRDLSALNDRFLPALREVSFQVRRGEIVGLAGVSGNGQKELEEVLAGLRKPSGGRVTLAGEEITGMPPAEIIRKGFAYIPGDRLGVGTASELDFTDNLILKSYRRPPLRKGIFCDYRRAGELAERLRREFDIRIPDRSAPVRLLSGGNLQKVILARELTSRPEFLLAVHPARGLDIGSAGYVRRTLEELRGRGVAILLISEDLSELLATSDRIAVIYGGRIAGILEKSEVSLEKLGLLMTGQKAAAG